MPFIPDNPNQEIQGRFVPDGEISHDFSLRNTISNIPSSAIQFGKDVLQPILHPIDTTKGIYAIGKGLIDLTKGSDTDDAKATLSVKDFFIERYGGWDNFKKTVEKDPVGFLADVSTVFTGGAGVAKGATKGASLSAKTAKASGVLSKTGEVLGRASELTNPMSAATSTTSAIAKRISSKSQSTANLLYGSALQTGSKAFKETPPEELGKVIKTGLDLKIPVSEKGLLSAKSYKGQLNNYIDTVIEQGKLVGKTKIDGNKIIKKLEESISPENLKSMPRKKEVAAGYQKVIDDLKGSIDKNGFIDIEDAHKLKKNIYKIDDSSYGKDYEINVRKQAEMSTAKEVNHLLREELKDGLYYNKKTGDVVPGNQFPNGAPEGYDFMNYESLNKDQKTMIRLNELAEEAIEAERGRKGYSGFTVDLLTGSVIGATSGKVLTGLVALVGKRIVSKFLQSPEWKSGAALFFNKVPNKAEKFGKVVDKNKEWIKNTGLASRNLGLLTSRN